MDGITFTGTGRSKKLAKVAVAKNALQRLLDAKLQKPEHPVFFEPTMPSIVYNQGVVDVDFTSDDPADANFILNEINRIQTTATAAVDAFQIPPATGAPLSTLPLNGAMGPPPGGASLQNKKSMGKDDDDETEEHDSGNCIKEEGESEEEEEDEEEEKVLKSKVEEVQENQDDSGLVDEDSKGSEEDSDLSPTTETKTAWKCEDEAVEQPNNGQVSILKDVELTAEILEEIQISMKYDEYKADVQSKYFEQRRRIP